MTVRLSADDARSWTASKVLHEGPAAYSSLAMLRGGTIGLLSTSESRSAVFGLKWLGRWNGEAQGIRG